MNNIESCEKCGVVVDMLVLQKHSADWDNSEKTQDRPYKDYRDFIHWTCPNCQHVNQKE